MISDSTLIKNRIIRLKKQFEAELACGDIKAALEVVDQIERLKRWHFDLIMARNNAEVKRVVGKINNAMRGAAYAVEQFLKVFEPFRNAFFVQ